MADSSSTKRRRLTLIGSAAAALALSLSLAPGATAAGPPDSSPGAAKTAWSGEPVTVMTRNLYLGADLMPVIGAMAMNPASVPAAAADTWAKVQATRPPDRMAAIAEEIADDMPAMVGLQEVTTWQAVELGVTTNYDFLTLLVDALAAEVPGTDMDYEVVEGATSVNFASGPIPIGTSLQDVTGYVAMSDRDVILRRGDVEVEADSAMSGNFTEKVVFQTALGAIVVDRGWGSADVSVGDASFRFVNSHLEAFAPLTGPTAEEIRVLQARELLEETYDEDKRMVYVGDYNSTAPTGDAYRELRKQLRDAWLAGNGMAGGDTCCQSATLTNLDSELDERIDLVLFGQGVRAVDSHLVGEDPSDMFGDPALWPSDHAGVVADLVFKR